MKRIKAKGVEVIDYELVLEEKSLYGSEVTEDFEVFTNYYTEEQDDVKGKRYTSDLFGND